MSVLACLCLCWSVLEASLLLCPFVARNLVIRVLISFHSSFLLVLYIPLHSRLVRPYISLGYGPVFAAAKSLCLLLGLFVAKMASSTGSSSLYTIDKLSSSNFTSWKFRMQMILIDRGLWEYVDGNPVTPVLDGTDAARLRLAEWKKKDNCALAQMFLIVVKIELC